MRNPYTGRPDKTFWRRAVSNIEPTDVDPVSTPPFRIGLQTKVATAGSCFAQHIARTLVRDGYNYFVAESSPATVEAKAENYGTFSARFGNIYTTRQLLQLFQRAYGLFDPVDRVWTCADSFVDPFRPQVQSGGFATPPGVEEDRRAHLAAVRNCFENCDVFIFTLGLTEAWRSTVDGAVFPLAPGVVGASGSSDDYKFQNFEVEEVVSDLSSFIENLRVVNPDVNVILTVSPVALIATFEENHVLPSTTYSKSVLRVAAEIISRRFKNTAYFPSYDIITGPHLRGRFFADDGRDVTPEGVDHVMTLFKRHYIYSENGASPIPMTRPTAPKGLVTLDLLANSEQISRVICDEEAIDPAAVLAQDMSR